ncbi:MAG: hypothetical protein J6T16_03020, partial [Opitutales bacterium]|nr:hypothetical protein [Opitutales bacterium]
MGRSFVSNNFTRRKFLLLAASFFIASIFWLGAYYHLSSGMTEWQKNRPIDIKNGSGLTRAKIYIDCSSIAGAAFCASAAVLIFIDRRKKNK